MERSEEVLVLEVGETLIGLPAHEVVAVVRAAAVTPLPAGPSGVDGVVDVHGTIVPVVEARARLGLGHAPLTPGDVFVLVRVGAGRAAIRVDGVRGLEGVRGVVPAGARRFGRAGDALVVLTPAEALAGDVL
ncbi:MAG: chemotaxis protein CheW, partial [Myxococcota bacterium]